MKKPSLKGFYEACFFTDFTKTRKFGGNTKKVRERKFFNERQARTPAAQHFALRSSFSHSTTLDSAREGRSAARCGNVRILKMKNSETLGKNIVVIFVICMKNVL